MGLRFRIALTIFLLEACLIAAVLVATLHDVQQTTKAQFEITDRVTISLLDDLARIALLTDDYAELQAFIEQSRNETRLQSVALVDLSGRVVAASDPARIGNYVAPQENEADIRRHLVDLGDYGTGLGTMAVEFNNDDLTKALNDAYRQGFAIALTGMVIIAFVSIGTGHLLTRRLSRLADVADRVAGGDMALRVDHKGRDEVARVGVAMNGMLDRLETQIHDVTRARDRLYLPTEAMHDGFAIWDAEDRLVLCNSRFRSFYGTLSISLEPGLPCAELVRQAAMHLVDRNHAAIGHPPLVDL
ncbi:MAG: HAMP domain-containing protein [Pseudomonadota bacterium]